MFYPVPSSLSFFVFASFIAFMTAVTVVELEFLGDLNCNNDIQYFKPLYPWWSLHLYIKSIARETISTFFDMSNKNTKSNSRSNLRKMQRFCLVKECQYNHGTKENIPMFR